MKQNRRGYWVRILVGEPDETTRRYIANVLERAGHVVTGRDCALRVLRTLQERKFDLVLLDCDLPGMAYHELLNLLPTLNSGIRIVLMG